MIKAAWRLILNSITTTVFLALIGAPSDEVTAVIGTFCALLWLQEEVIELIRGKEEGT